MITYSNVKLERILYMPLPGGELADVWLRTNIEGVEEEDFSGWSAIEVYFRTVLTQGVVEGQFNDLFAAAYEEGEVAGIVCGVEGGLLLKVEQTAIEKVAEADTALADALEQIEYEAQEALALAEYLAIMTGVPIEGHNNVAKMAEEYVDAGLWSDDMVASATESAVKNGWIAAEETEGDISTADPEADDDD